MKAISLSQPYAHLIAEGVKTLESRTWTTKYRGPLLICAALKPNLAARDFQSEVADRAASLWRPADLGHAVAVARLVNCRPMTLADEVKACCLVTPGRYVFELADIIKLDRPFPVKGMLGLFRPPFPPDALPESYR